MAATRQSPYRDDDVAVRPVPQRWQALQLGRHRQAGAARQHRGAGRDLLGKPGQAPSTSSQPEIAFGLFIAFGELLRLSLPGGREAAPIAMVGALAFAMSLGIAKIHGGHVPPITAHAWSSP